MNELNLIHEFARLTRKVMITEKSTVMNARPEQLIVDIDGNEITVPYHSDEHIDYLRRLVIALDKAKRAHSRGTHTRAEIASAWTIMKRKLSTAERLRDQELGIAETLLREDDGAAPGESAPRVDEELTYVQREALDVGEPVPPTSTIDPDNDEWQSWSIENPVSFNERFGESRIAWEMNNSLLFCNASTPVRPSGSSKSFDIKDAFKRRWEVKQLDPSLPVSDRIIRLGAEGTASLRETIDAIRALNKQIARLHEFVEAANYDALATDVSSLLAVDDDVDAPRVEDLDDDDDFDERREDAESFFDDLDEYITDIMPKLEKGEISKESITALDDILEILRLLYDDYMSEPEPEFSLDIKSKEKNAFKGISRTMPLSMLIDIASILDLPIDQVDVRFAAIVKSIMKSELFIDETILDDFWWSSLPASASKVFANVSGVVLVNKNSFKFVRGEKLDVHFRLVGISQSRPKYVYVENPGEEEEEEELREHRMRFSWRFASRMRML